MTKISHEVTTAEAYSGPIPPAQQLERYEQIQVGFADRIISMAESNTGHRQGMEMMVVTGNVKAQARGQVFAFILAILVLGTGIWLVVAERVALGLWVILGDILTLAAVFLVGRWMQKSERSSRREQAAGRRG